MPHQLWHNIPLFAPIGILNQFHAFEMMQTLESELGDESEARKYFMKALVRIA